MDAIAFSVNRPRASHIAKFLGHRASASAEQISVRARRLPCLGHLPLPRLLPTEAAQHSFKMTPTG